MFAINDLKYVLAKPDAIIQDGWWTLCTLRVKSFFSGQNYERKMSKYIFFNETSQFHFLEPIIPSKLYDNNRFSI